MNICIFYNKDITSCGFDVPIPKVLAPIDSDFDFSSGDARTTSGTNKESNGFEPLYEGFETDFPIEAGTPDDVEFMTINLRNNALKTRIIVDIFVYRTSLGDEATESELTVTYDGDGNELQVAFNQDLYPNTLKGKGILKHRYYQRFAV